MIKKKLLSNTIVSSALAFLVKVTAAFSSYLLFAIVARYMSANDFGVFSYFFSAAMLAALVGGFGQQMLIVKEIPAAQVHEDKSLEKGVYCFSFLITAFSALVVSVILFLTLYHHNENLVSEVILCCAVLCFLYSFSQSTIGALRVQNRTLFAIATRDLIWRILVIFWFVAIASWYVEYDKLLVVFFVMALTLLMVVLCHILLIRKGVSSLQKYPLKFKIKPWFSTSAGLTLVAVISGADLYLYTIVISRLFENEVVGAFFAALKTAELINLFLMTIYLIVAPKLSKAIAEKNIQNLQLECNAAILLLSIPTLIACLIMFAFAPYFMLIFDPSYMEYDVLMRLLVIGMLVNALTGSTGLLFQLSGMHWLQIVFQGGSLIISLLLLPLFVRFMGINGAAISFIVSKVLWNLLAVIFIRKRIGVDPTIVSLLGTKEVKRGDVLNGLKAKLLNRS